MSKKKMSGHICIGYGETADKCRNLTNINPYWCDECDRVRRDAISTQFGTIMGSFGVST